MLTKDEKRWIKRVQKALNECPSDRFGFYTIGDRDVEIYDKSNKKVELIYETGTDFCVAVEGADASLGELRFPSQVHSTAG